MISLDKNQACLKQQMNTYKRCALKNAQLQYGVLDQCAAWIDTIIVSDSAWCSFDMSMYVVRGVLYSLRSIHCFYCYHESTVIHVRS